MQAQEKNQVINLHLEGFYWAYPYCKKGYTLMELQSNKIFVSRDVVFKKEVFPFLLKGKHNDFLHIENNVLDSELQVDDCCDDLLNELIRRLHMIHHQLKQHWKLIKIHMIQSKQKKAGRQAEKSLFLANTRITFLICRNKICKTACQPNYNKV